MLIKFFLFKDSLVGAVIFFGFTLLFKILIFTSHTSLPSFFVLLFLAPLFSFAFGLVNTEKRQKRFVEETHYVVIRMEAALEFFNGISFGDWMRNGISYIEKFARADNNDKWLLQRVFDLTLKHLAEDFHKVVREQEQLRNQISDIKKHPENYEGKKSVDQIESIYQRLERLDREVNEKKDELNKFRDQVKRLNFRIWPDYAMYLALKPLK